MLCVASPNICVALGVNIDWQDARFTALHTVSEVRHCDTSFAALRKVPEFVRGVLKVCCLGDLQACLWK